MERVFGTAWIYVGHESQIKNAGDYFATNIGRKPVVMVRDTDGALNVVHNQCAHRGAMVVATEKGNAPEFTCCYHGWTYHLNGRLKAVPLNHGYPKDFDPSNPKTSMRAVPRVKSYRGFVFASMAADGPSLEEVARPYAHLARRHGRPRAGRRARGRRRHVQARLRRQLENLFREPVRRRASPVHPPLLDRGGAGAVRQRAFRRHRRDRDPADAAERGALLVLGNPGRHLDLSERPQLSRRLPRRFQAGRGAEGPGVPGIHRGVGEEEGQGRDEAHPRGAALEFEHLSERLADEPIPAVAGGAPDRGQPHRGADLQFPAERRARADVPQHRRVRQHRQRHGLAGADRRSRNLQPHRARPFQRRHRMAPGRPRLSVRRARRAWRPARRQLDQRGLYPQHAGCLARLYEPGCRRHEARAAS